MKICNLQLQIPGFEGILGALMPPFKVQLDPISPQCLVQEFHGVIAQDGKLVNIGNFMKLSSPVCVCEVSFIEFITAA